MQGYAIKLQPSPVLWAPPPAGDIFDFCVRPARLFSIQLEHSGGDCYE